MSARKKATRKAPFNKPVRIPLPKREPPRHKKPQKSSASESSSDADMPCYFDEPSATLVVYSRDLRVKIYQALDADREVDVMVMRVTDGGDGSTVGPDSMCPC